MTKDKKHIIFAIIGIVCILITMKFIPYYIADKYSIFQNAVNQTEKRINNLEFKIDSLILESEKTKVIIDSLYEEVYYYEH